MQCDCGDWVSRWEKSIHYQYIQLHCNVTVMTGFYLWGKMSYLSNKQLQCNVTVVTGFQKGKNITIINASIYIAMWLYALKMVWCECVIEGDCVDWGSRNAKIIALTIKPVHPESVQQYRYTCTPQKTMGVQVFSPSGRFVIFTT